MWIVPVNGKTGLCPEITMVTISWNENLRRQLGIKIAMDAVCFAVQWVEKIIFYGYT